MLTELQVNTPGWIPALASRGKVCRQHSALGEQRCLAAPVSYGNTHTSTHADVSSVLIIALPEISFGVTS